MRRREIIQGAGWAGLGALAGCAPVALTSQPSPEAAGSREAYQWRSVPYGAGGFITGFLFHPSERGLLYVRTDIGGAYRFDEAHQAWIPLMDHLGIDDADLMGVLSLAVDPNAPDRLYAACGLYLGPENRPGALMASDDRGATWRVHELGVHLGGNSAGRASGERLQVDPNDGQVLWLGTSRQGLLKSTDRGRRFNPQPLPAQHVSLVWVDPGSGSAGHASRTVYVGTHDQPGLWVSHDAGARFERVAGTPAQAPQRLAAAADGTLYVTFALGDSPIATNPSHARTGSVWKRSPDGRWSDITPERPGAEARGFGYAGVAVDRQQPRRLVVSTFERRVEGDEIFLSNDGGASWQALSPRTEHHAPGHPWLLDYMRTERRMGHWTSALALDPFDGSRALYGTGYGVWMTRDLPQAVDGRRLRWTFTVQGMEETATLEIRSPSQGSRLLAAMGDVAGAAWADPSRPPGPAFFVPTKETNRSVDYAELAPQIVARTGDGRSGGHWSDDGGRHWQPFAMSPRDVPGHAPGEIGHVAVCARGATFVYAPKKGPGLWTADRGGHWAACAGWPAGAGVPLKPEADRSIEGVYYLLDREHGRVLTSTDGGRLFQPLLIGLPRVAASAEAQLISIPGRPHALWLALNDRLLHVAGAGAAPRRIEAVEAAWMVATGPGVPGARSAHSLYLWGRVRAGHAPVAEGFFRSDDEGASFVRINDDAHRYGRLLSMTADSREHGVVYIAPHGRGVLVGRPGVAT